jgi:hypothetical protein
MKLFLALVVLSLLGCEDPQKKQCEASGGELYLNPFDCHSDVHCNMGCYRHEYCGKICLPKKKD